MTYFGYLLETGSDDCPDSYAKYLTNVCKYDEKYAKSMADLQFRSCSKSVTNAEIWSPVSMGDAMFITDQLPEGRAE